MKYSWEVEPVFCFTSDVDWASESVIEYSHNILSCNELKITYFVTHSSPFLFKINHLKLVNLLIHPNFLPNSSQGNTFSDVINYCMQLVPNADGFRSHRYFESNDIMDSLQERGFKFVSNHCTRCEINLRPLKHRSNLISIPIFFEDGCYLKMDPTLNFDNLIPLLESPGLKVINFHPAHIAFNSPNFAFTRSIKDSVDRKHWNNIGVSELHNLENNETLGIRDIIQEIIAFIYKNNHKLFSIHEIYNEYITRKDE